MEKCLRQPRRSGPALREQTAGLTAKPVPYAKGRARSLLAIYRSPLRAASLIPEFSFEVRRLAAAKPSEAGSMFDVQYATGRPRLSVRKVNSKIRVFFFRSRTCPEIRYSFCGSRTRSAGSA